MHTLAHTLSIQLQKQLVDDRIESVVLRVDEFKKQLETMNENLTSSSEKMQELHEKMRMLKELFKRIDQVEVRLDFTVKASSWFSESILNSCAVARTFYTLGSE